MVFIIIAFLAYTVVGLTRTWNLRDNSASWPPWLASVIAVVGISSVLFDKQIDSLLGGENWVFILETWSIYFAYALMTETCRAVGKKSSVSIRGWVFGAVTIWCLFITILFVYIEERRGTRSHFVRDMIDQYQALTIGLMYSLGIIVLGSLPILWLWFDRGLSVQMIRFGSALVIAAHSSRFIVTPIDFFNTGEPRDIEKFLYGFFVPIFYLGLISFAMGLMGLSLHRWYRETILRRRHLSKLREITTAHHIYPTGKSPVAYLIEIEDAVRAGTLNLTDKQLEIVDKSRAWLTSTHDTGPRMHYITEA